eukprot:02216.XXX_16908_18848_1 [CDS] Oithona nana genome sequencing.
MECPPDLTEKVSSAKQLYSVQSYEECSSLIQDCLSDSAHDKYLLAELHLLLAKCHRGRNDLKSAILSCQSSIEARPKWKDPFLYRSACFQALHQYFNETDGDLESNILQDRQEADFIVKDTEELFSALKNAADGQRIFLKPGTYQAKSLFLCGKNVALIGASVKDCILEFKNDTNQKLETFLICSCAGAAPTLLKRLTFKSITAQGLAKIKFLGVAGGTVQLEDCLFDATENNDTDAVYTNAKIAGNLAANYPPPYVIARFCVFDSCQSYGAFSAFRSRGSVQTCYFVNCGRSAIVANDCAKLSIGHCEFAQTDRSEQTLSSSHSDVTLTGCYFHGLAQEYERNVQAVALTCKSVANLTKNYFFHTGNGVSVIDADLTCSENLILNSSQPGSGSGSSNGNPNAGGLGLFTGLLVKSQQGNKVQVLKNVIKNCDVGIYVAGQHASPVIKDNLVQNSYFTGVFAECQSRPSLAHNQFNGGVSKNLSLGGKGLGVLLISGSSGLIGKNSFTDYEVSPIMVFSTCHPLLKDNLFDNIRVDDEKQKVVEKQMLEQFQADLFKKDEYFYIVDSEITEKELQEVILEKNNSN